MEYFELWEALTKSLARNLQAPLSQNVSNLTFVYAYIIAMVISNKRQLRLSFLCLIACLIVSNSVIYDNINGWQLHVFYSIIYLFVVPLLDKLKVMLALFVMALFNGLMAWDAYNYETTSTWLYCNYEFITTCIHAAIICTNVEWRICIIKLNNSIDNIRCIIARASCILHN